MVGRWRKIAAPIIARVIQENGTTDRKKLRAAIRAAYPFGARKCHPYKIWCSEVRYQLGITKRIRKPKKPLPCPGQIPLFE